MRNRDGVDEATPQPGAAVLRSGDLAALAGVSADTLRHYERVGVLPVPERSANGYRLYPARALERVRLVRRALSVGLTLAQLGRALRERDRNGSPCRTVHALAAAKLAQVERDLAELTARRDALRRTLAGWDRRLARTPRGHQARLLDHVVAPAPATRTVAATRAGDRRESAQLSRTNLRVARTPSPLSSRK
jgi:DNA-binding transcriptional MerR regulator